MLNTRKLSYRNGVEPQLLLQMFARKKGTGEIKLCENIKTNNIDKLMGLDDDQLRKSLLGQNTRQEKLNMAHSRNRRVQIAKKEIKR